MRVNPTSADLPSVLPPSQAAINDVKPGGASFGALHAESLARLSSVAAPAPHTARASTEAKPETSTKGADPKSARPRNETYQAVDGQPYEEIVSGPRNGMFINRSGNRRDGDAFVLVKRDGREFHIYGTGADRQVVPVGGRDKAADAQPAKGSEPSAKAVEYRDVEGRAFDEIMSGPRNGMFINRSGNARDGKAFVLVKRADHELHVYGSGDNRLVVRVVPPGRRQDTDTTPSVPVAGTPPAPPATPVVGTPSGGSSVLPS